jgi:acetyltransferase-like isoleucine patch superfamily enzyme
VRERAIVLWLQAIQAFDRLRLQRLAAREPGLDIHPAASTNFAAARYTLGPGAQLRIGPGVVTERVGGAVHFWLAAGARVEVGANTWLRTELAPIRIFAFEGARISIGPDSFLNGCHLSAKSELRLGRQAFVGPGSRVFDADQHALDTEHPELAEPVTIGDCAWIAADVTVLRGVTIGEHSVIGSRSLVTRDVPPHSLAFGVPARTRGPVGDRTGIP